PASEVKGDVPGLPAQPVTMVEDEVDLEAPLFPAGPVSYNHNSSLASLTERYARMHINSNRKTRASTPSVGQPKRPKSTRLTYEEEFPSLPRSGRADGSFEVCIRNRQKGPNQASLTLRTQRQPATLDALVGAAILAKERLEA